MPEQPSWLESLLFTVQTDAALSSHERQRRAAILHEIASRTRQDGPHVAQPHPDRARQFMPFAALKGYHELAHERERVCEPKRAMTEELSAELSAAIARLSKGSLASVLHYEDGCYTTTCGIVTEIDEPFRTLRIVKKRIPFDDIYSIELPTVETMLDAADRQAENTSLRYTHDEALDSTRKRLHNRD